jgi:glucose-6-phosphate isomerase
MPKDYPFTFDISLPGGIPGCYDEHVVRRLSAIKGYYADRERYEALLAEGDIVLYEVFQIHRPETAGELLHGVSIVHPGRIGDEYHMTKGHFHSILETGEVYYCLQGTGMMVMETPEGDWAVEELYPGRVLYVLPRWADRSVNTDQDEDLITFYAYPGNAGHDYGTIKGQGFRKLVVARDGRPCVADDTRWRPQSHE